MAKGQKSSFSSIMQLVSMIVTSFLNECSFILKLNIYI